MAGRGGKKSSTERSVEVTNRQRIITDAFYARIQVILETVLKKWEDRVLKDPAYKPTPTDVVSIMKAHEQAQSMLLSCNAVEEYLTKTRDELKRLEDRLLGLLQGE